MEFQLIQNAALRACSNAVALVGMLAALFLASATGVLAQERFDSPEDAVTRLVSAVRAGHVQDIIVVLGRSEIALSGNETADRKARAAFLVAYDLQHQIVRTGRTAELQVGPQNWTLPIPLVENSGKWQFDADKGREEIRYRRIGRNELNAIQVSLAYVDAQNEYAEANPQRSPVAGYAQRFGSSPNKKDGLYWPTIANEPRSPLGEAMALATRQEDRLGKEPKSYRGYYYKILTRQGASAPGGAADYIVDGNMIGGFALVAYPADYGNSGVMTLLVNHEGAVFQKDLGADTGWIASRMTAFDPDHTWKNVAAPDLAYDPR